MSPSRRTWQPACLIAVLTALAIVSPAAADDRFVQQGPALAPADAGNGDSSHFGMTVALSGDGNVALVGQPWSSTYPPGQCCDGAAWIFARSGTSWAPEARLATTTAELLGGSVALSGDGSTALLGGSHRGTAGAAWVFTRSGATWTQEAELAPPGGQLNWGLGDFAALSADGNSALVNVLVDDGSGAAWPFTRVGDTWAQQVPKLTTPSGHIGAVALSGDGSTALIGAGGDGAAWVFSRAGGTFAQGPELTDPRMEPDAAFGSAVALSADGNTALIGAPGNGGRVGLASVFKRSGGAWVPDGPPLAASDEAGQGRFGTSVSLSSDGSTAVIGGPFDNSVGAAWIFRRTGDGWHQLGPKLTANNGSYNGYFGQSVAVSGAGTTALVGDWWDTQSRAGAAWVFTDEPFEPFSPPAVVPPPGPAPSLTGLRLKPGAFRAARRGATTGGRIGTSISYRASVAGTATFTLLRELPGIRRAGTCVAIPPRTRQRSQRCLRLRALGSFLHTGVSGDNHVRFSGRLTGRTLKSGRYVLRAVLTAGGIQGKPARARFRVTTAR